MLKSTIVTIISQYLTMFDDQIDHIQIFLFIVRYLTVILHLSQIP